ncbi:Protein IQ-DOMAIN 14 [Cucurbita argyrosperma subsp. argyrosperma]|nr:Protein IQ-DOMAIN 14 [Cucurbita argyrosperma subsp. argyrosperma]
MGKRGRWIAAIKRVFTPNSKEKPPNEFEKRSNKGVGKLRHGESNSLIPLFREPSSVEKIFLDFEREQQRVTFRPSSPPTPPFVTPRNASPRLSSSRRPSPPVSPPRVKNRPKTFRFRPEPTLRYHHASATKIQAAYRGYVARRSFRALKGLVRLQGVVRGQNVKRQTMNAMKQMQLLVRVQSQIQSRRIQMLDTQARQHHGPNHNDLDIASGAKLGFTQLSEAANQEDWDDSLLTREEIEARLQRKAEAIMKRERAMAYAYSHQLWKASPNSAQAVMADIRAAGYPRWWNWLDRQQPPSTAPSEPQTLQNFLQAPQTPSKHHQILPKPTRNSPAVFRTPPGGSSRWYSRPKGSMNGAECCSPYDVALKDDESLTSCPPFTVPRYMTPTVSAKAKLRGCATPPPIDTHSSKTRLSFGFKWNKPNLFSNSKKDSGDKNAQMGLNKIQSLQSLSNLSLDSTASLPAGVGRKPFNRFV